MPADVNPVSDKPKDGQSNRPYLKSSGAVSNMSGTTTTRTSNSVVELADLSTEAMLDALPALYDLSGKILDICAPRNVSGTALEGLMQKLGLSESRAHKNLDSLKKTFDETITSFPSEPYINLSLALRGLFGVRRLGDIGDGPWRPDVILFRANLASTVADLMSRKAGAETDGIPLEKLDRDFPERFLSGFKVSSEAPSTGSSALLEESFSVGLELRTQFAIHALAVLSTRPNFDPNSVVKQTFNETENGPIRAWNVPGLQHADLSPAQRNALRERHNDIHDFILKNAEISPVKGLQARYPLSRFVRMFIEWARTRDNEMVKQLDYLNSGQGIGYGVQAALEDEIIRRNTVSASGDPDERGYIRLDYQPPSDVPQSESSEQAPEKNVIPSTAKPYKYEALPPKTYELLILLFRFNSPAAIQHLFKFVRGQGGTSRPPDTNAQGPRPGLDNIMSSSKVNIKTLPKQSSVPRIPKKSSQLLERLRAPEQSDYSASSLAEPPDPQARPVETEHSQNDIGEEDPDIGMTPLEDEANFIAQAQNDPTAIPSREERQEVISLHRQLEREQDKENDPPPKEPRLLSRGKVFERQPDAERVRFESQPSRHISTPLHKAVSDVSTSQVSEDEGFEEDTRMRPPESALANRKRPAPTKTIPSSSKRVRIRQARSSAGPSQQMTGHTPAETTQSNFQVYQMVNRHAKVFTGRAGAMKPLQTRTPWSAEEVETLQELIELHGVSWAYLKTMDEQNILSLRDQVGLKDKARNMKFDFLK
ncbi:MAG: hypothetical protein LQ340_000110 [Diploschistes diacapsis]|nr:MAG: hypothetical protein LQ340_000110 [Diploschistes diacapsis]